MCTESLELTQAIHEIHSHRDATLQELSEQRPTLVVLLRHTGCTFGYASLAQLLRAFDEVQQTKANLAIVHMGPPLEGTLLLQNRDLPNAHRFSDPHCRAGDLASRARLAKSGAFPRA